MNEPDQITMTINRNGEEMLVTTYPHAYRNLMVLLNNALYLDGFGECGGQGRCATCLITLSTLNGDPQTMDRNERATLHKMGLDETNIRLSCQCLVTPALHGAVVTIVEDGI